MAKSIRGIKGVTARPSAGMMTDRNLTRVEGMDLLLHNMLDVPDKLAKKENAKIVRAGAAPIAKDARKRVKKPTKRQAEKAGIRMPRTGLLSKSISIKVIRSKSGPAALAIIGPNKKHETATHPYAGDTHKPANIAHLVEAGHKGGARPHPFLRPAYDSNRAASQKIIAQKTWSAISKLMKRPT